MSLNVSEPAVRSGDLRRVAQGRRSFWATLLIMAAMLGLLGTAAWMNWLDPLEAQIPQRFQLAARIALALAPALLSLILFALLTRKNDMVSRIVFLLWLVTGALYLVTVRPVANWLFPLESWMTALWWSNLLVHFLITATLEMFLVYLVLRFGVYPGGALQTVTDGPIYGAAAALGLATTLSLQPLLAGEISSISDFALWIGTLAMGYTAVGAMLGYFMAQARFKRMHLFYLVAGFLFSTLLHTLFFVLYQAISAQMAQLPGLGGLIFAFVFALMSFLFIYWRLWLSRKDFMRIAALVEIKEEAARPRSLLEDVIHLVETQQIDVRPSPPLPPVQPASTTAAVGEIADLENSWATLIQEQEASHDQV
jgi:RsiW-degrading membrane proteinase PrsW (M82 family)